MLDTAFSIVRRVARRRSFAMADKDHLHHRLMRLGHGPRRTVVLLWVWTALLSALALFPLYTKRGNGVVPVGVIALGLLLWAVLHRGAREARRGGDNGEVVEEVDLADPVVELGARRDRQTDDRHTAATDRPRTPASRFDAGGPG
jgi:UDP-GlcNAc:undecaprenyl-phosphate GlcNAc-1-phosphate transferase